VSLLTEAIERAGGFLLEPAERGLPPRPSPRVAEVGLQGPVSIAVMGLATRSGARTVAAGLALALGRHSDGPFLLCLGGAPPPGGNLRASEVPPALTRPEEVASYGGTLLRLAGDSQSPQSCVWSVPAREAARAAAVVADADTVIAVAGASAEPALAGMVCSLLAERCRRVLLVSNAAGEPEPWSRWAAASLPESRLGAALVARGRLPGGRFGRSLVELGALGAGVASGGLAPHHGLFTGRRGR
jgi:hypothetical protein